MSVSSGDGMSAAPGGAARDPGSVAFRAGDLTVRYTDADHFALDGVSMSVPTGSLYAVLGPNGSGKSTLLRALMGTLPVVSGECSVGGRPVEGWRRRELAREVGVVPQTEPITFPVSVREIVALGRCPHLGPLSPEGPEDRRAIAEALDRCDISGLADRTITELSGGEMQRVRIARALAQKPRFLALDEPTSSLDIAHEMAILELLRGSVQSGMTVLLVTHHLNLAARFADRMLLMDRGRVAAEGTPGEVFREETLRRVYDWELDVREDPITGTLRVTPLSS